MGGSFLSGQLTAAIERADNNKTQAHYSPTVGWLQSQQVHLKKKPYKLLPRITTSFGKPSILAISKHPSLL